MKSNRFRIREVKSKDGCNDHTGQGTEEVTEYQIAWLGQGNVYSTVAQNRRSALFFQSAAVQHASGDLGKKSLESIGVNLIGFVPQLTKEATTGGTLRLVK